MQPWSLITPSSRGLGLALTRQVLRRTTIPVVAASRRDPDETKETILDGINDEGGAVAAEARLTVLKLDVLDEDSIAAAASACASRFPKNDHYLHLAFVAPGILFPEKSPAQIDAQDTLLAFRTNVIGPLLLLKHFAHFLPRKSTALPSTSSSSSNTASSTGTHLQGLPAQAVWANMSARVGSISDNRLGGWYSYRASKAALNQATRTFDNHLRSSAGDNAIAVSLHPGTVKTDLSKAFWANVKEEKLFEPDWAAGKLVDVVKGLKVDGRGRCWDWKGEEVPP